MNYIFILLASFLSSFGMGYSRFFGVTYLYQDVYALSDKKWIIQLVGALMTIGPFIIYPLSAPLAASMKKHRLMFCSSAATALCIMFGVYFGWPGSVWSYMFVIGVLTGLFNVAKMSCIPLEAERSGKSIFTLNAWMTIVFIIAMLLGLVAGTKMYEVDPQLGTYIGAGIFFVGGICSLPITFPKERVSALALSFKDLVEDSLKLSLKYPLYLLSSPILWGVASALSLAVTAYVEEKGIASATASSFMPLFSAIGIIVGNIISTKFTRNEFKASFIAGFLMTVFIIMIPVVVETGMAYSLNLTVLYYLLAGVLIFIGGFFGCCTNLIDAELLNLASKEGLEATGAGLQSIALSFFSFVIGGFVGLAIIRDMIGPISQFVFISIFGVIALVFIGTLAVVSGSMNREIKAVLYRIVTIMIKLRYKVNVTGLEELKNNDSSLLVLPNHPAEVDPVIVGAQLWELLNIRPVVDEKMYQTPVAHSGFKLIDTIPMPDMLEGAGTYKQYRIKNTMDEIVDSLKGGRNILLYPAGRLMRSGTENLAGSSGAAQLIERVENCKVLVVRTRGLLGSSFSTFQTNGETPALVKTFLAALKTIAMNLFFFAPRRTVTIDLKLIDRSEFSSFDPRAVNTELENFYNGIGPEEPSFIPYRFWNKTFTAAVSEVVEKEQEAIDLSDVSEDVQTSVRMMLHEKTNHPLDEILPEINLAEDIGLDSLDKAEVMFWLEEEYEVGGLQLSDISTVGDVMAYAGGIKQTDSVVEAGVAPEKWNDKQPRPVLMVEEGGIIQEAFLRTCDRMNDAVATSDEQTGVLSWKDVKRAALIMAGKINLLPGDNVGIILPASAGTSLVIMATLLAGKTPVMLNWTTGRKNLEHAADLAKLDSIITSGRFLDKLTGADFGSLIDKFVFTEDIKGSLTLDEKISGVMKARQNADTLMKRLGIDRCQSKDAAVILFTSGSESAPKGVPLSHENILTNISAIMRGVEFTQDDTLYGFLPPFHSFGFTVTTILPAVTGLKATYYPNPTEGSRLASGCAKWKPTILCGTPSFLNGILNAGDNGNFESLRYLVTGAEKLPESLVQATERLGNNCCIYEGYGITECSPVLTLNANKGRDKGVGMPLDTLELKIVDPDTYEELPIGERGVIIASGPSIFSGYLKLNKDPFIEIDGKKWYNTGDLGILDSEGYLALAGRMKRFVKIGGEMISLPAIEETLTARWPATEDGPVLAVHADEKAGERPEIILFTSTELELTEVNAVLKEAGFNNLSKVGGIKKLDAIPLLGTGKTDYQTLKKLA